MSQAQSALRRMLLHGIIDLAERNGNDERRVTDHKTGKNRTQEGLVVGGGEVLQPVLYSIAVEALRKIRVKEAQWSDRAAGQKCKLHSNSPRR